MSFPRYPAYKDSGINWIGEIPNHWSVIPLARVASQPGTLFIDGDWVESKDLADEGVRYITTGNIGQGKYKEQGSGYVSHETFKELQCTEVFPGDVLISRLNLPIGRACVVPDLGERIITSVDNVITRPDDKYLPSYLAYMLSSASHFANMEVLARGTTMQRISRSVLGHVRFALPDLEEQQVIASFLDHETTKIDALIAEQQRLIELLQEKRQAVISHAVTKGLNPDAPMKDSGVEWLGEVPEHWEIAQLNQLISKITNGYVGPTRDILQDEGIRYLQSLHIKNNKILFETPYYVSEEWSAAKEKSILNEGDVLIVQTGDIGQSAVVTKEFEGCNCHALIVVSPRSNVLTGAWLSWVLNSTFGKETLLSIQTGALHPHLNCGNVKYISIPAPPLGEQTAICDYIATKNLEADELIDASCKSIELMRERRSALISAAVTGQIDVRGLVPEASAA